MPQLSGPTWRRLKSCLEYKFQDIHVPATNHDDRLKQLGLLLGLSEDRTAVLYDESLQLQLGEESAGRAPSAEVETRVHELAKTAPLERYLK